MVPDIPYSLDIKIKRERYLAKQALQVLIKMMKITFKYFFSQDAERPTQTPDGQSSHDV